MCAAVKRDEGVDQRFRFVPNTGLVAALPLSLSARPKRKSDRRRHEARHDGSFVIA
ncbi:MAG: hypothetical protein ACRDPM_06985 [Solirubrobacteraceae bacterium]